MTEKIIVEGDEFDVFTQKRDQRRFFLFDVAFVCFAEGFEMLALGEGDVEIAAREQCFIRFESRDGEHEIDARFGDACI